MRAAWEPVEVVEARRLEQVLPAIERVEAAAQRGLFAVGLIAYEAGPAFDPAVAAHPDPGVPLVWFGLYERTELLPAPAVAGAVLPFDHRSERIARSVDRAEFARCLDRIRDYLLAGDIYQVNYTFRETHRLHVDAFELLRCLAEAHPVPYAAYLHAGDFRVLSLSPELFLRRRGRTLESQPMKGTAARCPGWAEDEAARRALARDPKNRAENVMIVDLVRNDLGRVCRTGSVHVPSLFDVARYATVHQMTSTVRGELADGAGLVDVLRAAFPPGSVTGAPKVRATQIIAELETVPRDIYCGAVGLVEPGGDFTFNVAIRTLVCREAEGELRATLGLGSGIVVDSDPQQEWEECRAKGRFLDARPVRFQLLETLRLEEGAYVWLVDHLRRLRRSASYFGFAVDGSRVVRALRAAREAAGPGAHRVRLLVDRAGAVRCEHTPLAEGWPREGVRVRLAPERVRGDDVWTRHKTTQRALYDASVARIRAMDIADELFLNERGELVEGAITNVLIKRDGTWWVPAEDCGGLPGIWRARAVRSLRAQPTRLTLADLHDAEQVLIGNSVRGGVFVRELALPDGERRRFAVPEADQALGAERMPPFPTQTP